MDYMPCMTLTLIFCQRDVHHGKSVLRPLRGTIHLDQAMEPSAPSMTIQPYYTSPYIATSAVTFILAVLSAVWIPAEKVLDLASMSPTRHVNVSDGH